MATAVSSSSSCSSQPKRPRLEQGDKKRALILLMHSDMSHDRIVMDIKPETAQKLDVFSQVPIESALLIYREIMLLEDPEAFDEQDQLASKDDFEEADARVENWIRKRDVRDSKAEMAHESELACFMNGPFDVVFMHLLDD